jgi:signal transduction histidine kinase/DNA-binding NarL/FixJ family response regulator
MDVKTLDRSGSLHWYHWLVVCLSIFLTVFAWYFSQKQVDEKNRIQFLRESDQVVELISDRMRKYEDGLWGGVAAIQAKGGDITYKDWKIFADSLRIDIKYPGINGIGVIHYVPSKRLNSYLEEQRQQRPDYKIHPEHNEGEFFPITYIEPADVNAKAVGLDMAHETNRYTAAKKARDTGLAQITGPITLVQDEGKTPGFLFYAPFYKNNIFETQEDRTRNLTGLVYAPFVVKKLMRGVLHRENRRVGIQIRDGNELLYDDHVASVKDFDPSPMFKKQYDVKFYGRSWVFNIWSTQSFRNSVKSDQPLMILVGGIIIDSLLLFLFVLISRSNRRAVVYADTVTQELQKNAANLKQTNQDLDKAKSAAESANQAKSMFLANMSHEIRTPMNGIMGYTQILLRDKGLDKETITAVNTIGACGKSLLKMINEVLDISKIEAGKMELNLHDFSLNDVIDSYSSLFEIRCQQKQVRWTVKGLSDPALVHGDENKLRQALNNLLSNAVKFTDSGEVKFSVTAMEKNQYRFDIIDTGYGVPFESQDKIFDSFQQDKEGEKKGGTGLGLAISKKLLGLMGSDLILKSEINEGARFYFTLELPPAKDAIKNDNLISRAILHLAPNCKIKALIVDDVKENRDVLAKLLLGIGVDIIEAENGLEGVEKVKEHQPDIIFMDMRMPVMRGEDAIKIIKEEFDQIKLVAITASALDRRREYYLDLGCHEYISKPFEEGKIFNCLNELLNVEFIFDEDIAEGETTLLDELDFTQFSIPKDLHEELKDSAIIYNVTGIEKSITRLEQSDEVSSQLTQRLHILVGGYEMEEILKVLESVQILE